MNAYCTVSIGRRRRLHAAMIGDDPSVWYEVEPLAVYRMNPTSHSKSAFRTGESARDLRRAASIQRTYLPPSRAAELSRKAKRGIAFATIQRAHEMLALPDLRAAARQGREAVKSDASPLVIRRTLRLFGRIMRQVSATKSRGIRVRMSSHGERG